jgi:hypothetical protein
MTIASTGLCRRQDSAARRLLALGVVVLILGPFLLACNEDDDDNGTNPVIRHPQDFLPPGTQGMPAVGSPRIATDTAGLQDIVNGGFQVYTNNGFQELAEQTYEGTVGSNSATVRIWIFDLGDAANAEALHDELLQEGSWEEWDGVGDAAHRRTELFSHIILFRRDNYSARLDISNSSQDAKDLVVLFATHIDQRIIG